METQEETVSRLRHERNDAIDRLLEIMLVCGASNAKDFKMNMERIMDERDRWKAEAQRWRDVAFKLNSQLPEVDENIYNEVDHVITEWHS